MSLDHPISDNAMPRAPRVDPVADLITDVLGMDGMHPDTRRLLEAARAAQITGKMPDLKDFPLSKQAAGLPEADNNLESAFDAWKANLSKMTPEQAAHIAAAGPGGVKVQPYIPEQ